MIRLILILNALLSSALYAASATSTDVLLEKIGKLCDSISSVDSRVREIEELCASVAADGDREYTVHHLIRDKIIKLCEPLSAEQIAGILARQPDRTLWSKARDIMISKIPIGTRRGTVLQWVGDQPGAYMADLVIGWGYWEIGYSEDRVVAVTCHCGLSPPF